MARAGSALGRRMRIAVVAAAVAVVIAGTAFALVRNRGATESPPATNGLAAPGTSVESASGVTSPGAAPVSAAAPVTARKPVLQGLIGSGFGQPVIPPAGFNAAFHGFVLNVPWSELEPQSGGPLNTTTIDQTLAGVRQLNAQYPSWHLAFKLRVFTGTQSPGWAMQAFGPPVALTEQLSGASGQVPRFWLPGFGVAYANLQRQLASRYDSVAEIRETSVARCTTFFDEPFERDATTASDRSSLVAAGFTFAADERCHREEIDAMAVWKYTQVDLSLNPYQHISADGRTQRTDLAFTETMMRYCRDRLGSRCGLAQSSLQSNPPPAKAALYAVMRQMGPGTVFQTVAPNRLADWQATLQYGVQLGGNSVEMAPGGPRGYLQLPLADLTRYSNALIANPSPA